MDINRTVIVSIAMVSRAMNTCMSSRVFRACFFMALACPIGFISRAEATRVDTVADPVISAYHENRLTLKVRSVPLIQVLDELRKKAGVHISGLENRSNEIITFSTDGERPEECIRRLFRQIGEENYAFEFMNSRLSRVVVLPEASATGRSDFSRHTPGPPAVIEERMGSAVKIKNIVEGSQAETVDLRTGDLVVAYDGIEISAARDLIKEVKERPEDQTVEMTIVRDGFPMQVVLNGGFIGINIQTVRLPKEELDTYRSAQGN